MKTGVFDNSTFWQSYDLSVSALGYGGIIMKSEKKKKKPKVVFAFFWCLCLFVYFIFELGYVGAVFDGRYVYLSAHGNSETADYHGKE